MVSDSTLAAYSEHSSLQNETRENGVIDSLERASILVDELSDLVPSPRIPADWEAKASYTIAWPEREQDTHAKLSAAAREELRAFAAALSDAVNNPNDEHFSELTAPEAPPPAPLNVLVRDDEGLLEARRALRTYTVTLRVAPHLRNGNLRAEAPFFTIDSLTQRIGAHAFTDLAEGLLRTELHSAERHPFHFRPDTIEVNGADGALFFGQTPSALFRALVGVRTFVSLPLTALGTARFTPTGAVLWLEDSDESVRDACLDARLAIIPVPATPVPPNGVASALNYVLTASTVFVPTFGHPNDESAVQRIAEIFPERRAIAQPAAALANAGYSLRSLTTSTPNGERATRLTIAQFRRQHWDLASRSLVDGAMSPLG